MQVERANHERRYHSGVVPLESSSSTLFTSTDICLVPYRRFEPSSRLDDTSSSSSNSGSKKTSKPEGSTKWDSKQKGKWSLENKPADYHNPSSSSKPTTTTIPSPTTNAKSSSDKAKSKKALQEETKSPLKAQTTKQTTARKSNSVNKVPKKPAAPPSFWDQCNIKKYPRHHHAAAIQIQRIARGGMQRRHCRIMSLQDKLDTLSPDRAQATLRDIQRTLQADKKEFRKLMYAQAKAALDAKVQTVQENKQTITQLRQEYKELQEDIKSIHQEMKAMKVENTKLATRTRQIEQHCGALQGKIKMQETMVAKMRKVVSDYEDNIAKFRESIDLHEGFRSSENKMKIRHMKDLGNMIEMIEDRCNDEELVDEVLSHFLTMETGTTTFEVTEASAEEDDDEVVEVVQECDSSSSSSSEDDSDSSSSCSESTEEEFIAEEVQETKPWFCAEEGKSDSVVDKADEAPTEDEEVQESESSSSDEDSDSDSVVATTELVSIKEEEEEAQETESSSSSDEESESDSIVDTTEVVTIEEVEVEEEVPEESESSSSCDEEQEGDNYSIVDTTEEVSFFEDAMQLPRLVSYDGEDDVPEPVFLSCDGEDAVHESESLSCDEEEEADYTEQTIDSCEWEEYAHQHEITSSA